VPAGKVRHVRDRIHAASRTFPASTPCVRSTSVSSGAMERIAPFISPTEGSDNPKSVSSVITPGTPPVLGRASARAGRFRLAVRGQSPIPYRVARAS